MKSVKELMNMKGRVALITGGAGHIGSTMAEALAEVGATIVLVDINKEALQRKSQDIKITFKTDILALAVDLADTKAVQKIPSQILKKFGRIDTLINCAAFTGRSKVPGWNAPFQEQSVDTWRLTMEVNLTVIFVLAQACEAALKANKTGSIINISSIYGMVGPDMSLYEGTNVIGHPAAYDAAKGGVIQLSRYLATILAPDIRVNAISIGGVFRGHTDPFLSRYISKTPLKRMATEEDLKGAGLYLASDLSKYVTGHNLVVDGGWTAW